jgi:hypothetical protein
MGAANLAARITQGFPVDEVLPQPARAADLGLDPAPFLAVVSDSHRQ